MLTARELAERRRAWSGSFGQYGHYKVCPTCRLYCHARNARRHAKACARRKREQPAAWTEWRDSYRSENQ